MSTPKSFSGRFPVRAVLFAVVVFCETAIPSFATPAPEASEARDCGLLALARLAPGKASGTKPGLESLEELERLSRDFGLELRMARREDASAPVPVPCVVHWRLGHFSAVVAAEAGRLQLDDPVLGAGPTWLEKEAFDGLASGFFLVPSAGRLPPGWREVQSGEGSAVRGGHSLSPKPGSVGPGNPKAKEKGCRIMPGGAPPRNCGMADWDIALMMAGLEVSDTPLGYRPPFGPEVFFNLQYNERESNQPATLTYANFGPLWNCDWIGSLTFQGTSAFFNRGQGGISTFTGFDEGTQSYQPDYQLWQRLVRVNATRCELLLRDGSKLVFALADNPAAPTRLFMTEVVDPQGNKATISYDGFFRVSGVSDALGRTSAFTYGTGAQSLLVKKITDPFGRFATFDYDGLGRLIRITDAIGLTSDFTYDASNRMLTMVTGYGTTSFAYGTVPGSRFLEVTHPNGDKERVEQRNDTTPGVPASDPAELVPEGSYANFLLDHWNTFYWDRKAFAEAAGDYTRARHYHFLRELGSFQAPVLESIRIPGENRIWISYQGQTSANVAGPGVMGHSPSAVARVLDDGSTQRFRTTYNSLGNPLSETDPAGRELIYAYAANGIDLVEIRRKTGAASSVRLMAATYDARHLPLTITDAAGQTTAFTWNARGQLASVTDALNRVTVFHYDTSGYLASVDLPLPGTGDSVALAYDATGRLRTITETDGYALTYDYDALDRVTRVTYPDGTFEETTRQLLHVSSFRDRLGRITSFAYDALRQLESATDPLARVTRYEWCKCGDLKALIDPMGRRTSWKHDVAARVTAKVYPDGGTESYRYDAAGRLSSITDAKGQAKVISYDPSNQVTGLSYQDALVPTPSVAVAYDPWFTRPLSRTDGVGTTTFGYHPITGSPSPGAGMLASVDGPMPNDTIGYAYDAAGRLVSREIGGVAMAQTFDDLDRVVAVTNALGAFTYGYEGATSRNTAIALPGGWQTLAEFDDDSGDRRLLNIRHLRPDASPLSRHDYTYDSQGRLLGWSRRRDGDPATDFSITLDNADRLTAFNAPGQSFSFTYDDGDNRLTETINGVTAASSFNPLNELMQVDSLAALPQLACEWDAEDRLVSVEVSGTTLRTEFTYDGLSRCVRITERDGAVVNSDRRFVWCGYERCEERGVDGSTVLRRFFPQGEEIGGQAFFCFRDHLGSVREMTDAVALRARYDYDPWGRRTKLSGDVDSRRGFTGHFTLDDPELVLAPFRAYDPEVGRWLSRDPLGEWSSLNLYAYAANQPTGLVDPTGLKIDMKCGDEFDLDPVREYLKGTPLGDAIDAVDASKEHVELVINNQQKNQFDYSDTNHLKIYWDPRAAMDLGSNRSLSPAILAGHEFGHAEGFLKDRKAHLQRCAPDPTSKYENREEERVIHDLEAASARMKGENVRHDHYYQGYFRVSGPTSRNR